MGPGVQVGWGRIELFTQGNGLASLVFLDQGSHIRVGWNRGAGGFLGWKEKTHRAIAGSKVFCRNAIDLGRSHLGQTVAVPFDGNDAYPDGYWEITSAVDLNQIVGLPKDGLRRLLVTAEDVAGNPMPMNNTISAGVDSLQIFIDSQGPQVTDVTVNNLTQAQYDLFDPKPSVTGFTPLVTSLKIAVRDLPLRIDQALHRSLAHAAYHIGQVVYLAKLWAGDRWDSLSIPMGQSVAFNATLAASKAPYTATALHRK